VAIGPGGRLLAVVLAVILACSGCSVEKTGQPVPGHTSQAPTGPPELDLASYERRVCELLTYGQLAVFAIRDPGTPAADDNGPKCNWQPGWATGSYVGVTIPSRLGYGLDGVYARKAQWPFFEEAGDINGTAGTCITVVGVRRDLLLETYALVSSRTVPEYGHACSVSDRVASMVIDTVRRAR
jgi:uncharacterized protein DUF3558